MASCPPLESLGKCWRWKGEKRERKTGIREGKGRKEREKMEEKEKEVKREKLF